METKDWEELPKVFTPALKKRVLREWHAYFSNWGVKRMSFAYIVGPLSVDIGFEARIGYSSYLPGFSVHNLSRSSDFLVAGLDLDLKNIRSGGSRALILRWHDKNYRDAVQHLKAQIPMPYNPPITLNDMIQAYRRYGDRPFHYPTQEDIEDSALICAWAGAPELAQDCLDWARDFYKEYRDKPKQGLDRWYDDMMARIADPETLRVTAREEIIKHKLTKIPSCCFIDAPYQECLTDTKFVAV